MKKNTRQLAKCSVKSKTGLTDREISASKKSCSMFLVDMRANRRKRTGQLSVKASFPRRREGRNNILRYLDESNKCAWKKSHLRPGNERNQNEGAQHGLHNRELYGRLNPGVGYTGRNGRREA